MIKRIKIEIDRRIKDEDTVYAVIGPELRLRRLALNKTLKFVSYKICSVSYTCKIERNDIRPNASFLHEISKRLGMDDNKISMLLNLRETLEVGIKSILFNDYKEIKKIIDENTSFLNYRYKLLVFLYEANNNNMQAAKAKYDELSQISRTMTDYDFKIFAIISAIYLFKSGCLTDSYNLLLSLEKMELNKNMNGVISLYLFYVTSGLGKPEAIYYHEEAKNYLYSIGSYELLDYINYELAIFYIKHDSFNFAEKLIDTLNSNAYKKSISFILAYLSNDNLKGYSKKNLIGIAKCIYDYKFDSESFKDTFESMNGDYYQLDYSPLLFEFELNDNIMDKYNYIVEKISKNPIVKEDYFLRKYFLNKMNSISSEMIKYKAFTDLYDNLLRKE